MSNHTKKLSRLYNITIENIRHRLVSRQRSICLKKYKYICTLVFFLRNEICYPQPYILRNKVQIQSALFKFLFG